jgi:hypothetical protein
MLLSIGLAGVSHLLARLLGLGAFLHARLCLALDPTPHCIGSYAYLNMALTRPSVA